MFHRRTNKSLSALFITAVLLTSCASYNKQAGTYYTHLRQGNFEKAATALDNNKLLNKDRNRLLYLLERGKISHLLNQWDSSNKYLNEADDMMERTALSAKDIAVGTLINPMMQSYRAEAFEKYLVHYYKALNYIQLNQPQEAMVEARRISLTNYEQQDKTPNSNKYADDAFSFMLQGLIYEKNKDINNAFIAYRNAADVYLKNNGSYYETRMPEQLKKDVLRTASQNGFLDELSRYEKLFNITFTKEIIADGGELIIFWENGSAPVKTQQDLYFSLFKDAGGAFFFTDASGLFNVPYNLSSGYNTNDIRLENLRSFRVALPRYQAQSVYFNSAGLQVNNITYPLEQVENVNTLAFATLKERLVKELSTTLTRLAIKKLAEAAIRPADKKDNSGKTEEEKKKQEKKDNQREAIALGLQLLNFATEKADTRNWQSLPHSIFYTRVPLQKGVNEMVLQLNGGSPSSVNLNVIGNGGMQFRNVCTLK